MYVNPLYDMLSDAEMKKLGIGRYTGPKSVFETKDAELIAQSLQSEPSIEALAEAISQKTG